MKKHPIILGISALVSIFTLPNTINAEYDLQIDSTKNEVYLMSGDTKIELDNAEEYLSTLIGT